MNDRLDPDSTDDSPEIAEVRRLLGEARTDEPMPADVAARLDDVLADLSDQRSRTTAPSRLPEVVPIEAHRRRRAAGMLVAAAAIVVGGVVAAQNIHLTSTSNSQSTASEASQAQADSGTGNHVGNGGQPPRKQPQSLDAGRAVVVRPRHFAADARKGQQLLQADSLDTSTSARPCTDLPRHGRVVPATYQHAPAALVYRRAEGSSQVVSLYVCGSGEPVRTTTLPVP